MKSAFYLVAFLFISAKGWSQSEIQSFINKKLPSFIPVSPNAASITRSADISPNKYSGLVNISIPLYDIPLKGIKIPVTLGYNSSGVKVEEISSSYGMSWSLMAGGVISRVVKGKPDEGPGGYMTGTGTTVDLYVRDQLSAAEKESFERSAANGDIDTEPDIYSYSFPGMSGKFFMAPSGRIITIPYIPLKITNDVSGGFTIIDTYGNKYEFKRPETSFTYTNQYNSETNAFTSQINPETTTNAWYLTKVVTAYNEQVTFSYAASTVHPTYNSNHAGYFLAEATFPTSCASTSSPHPLQYFVRTSSYQEINQQRVTRIQFPSGEIELNYQLARTDLPGDAALTNIKVKNVNSIVKEYSLAYNYFSDRLFLSQIQESNQGITLPPYIFEYNNASQLPARDSYSQDFWGYYNGASNQSLIPVEINMVETEFPLLPQVFGDANREPHAEKMEYGVLSKITYPTGGHASFEFEPNTYSKIGNEAVAETIYTLSNNNISAVGNSSGTPVYSNTFNVEFAQIVTISYNVLGGATSVQLIEQTAEGDIIEFLVSGNSNTVAQTATITRVLYPGTYKLRAFNYEEEFTATINVQYQSRTGSATIHEKIGGGLRIKKIMSLDNVTGTTQLQEFIYKTSLEDSYSSGVLVNSPVFNYYQRFVRVQQCINASYESVANYYVKLASPVYALNSTAGSFVGYKGAIVRNSQQNKQGYTITIYRAPDNFQDQQFDGFPFTPVISKDFKRGQTIEEDSYDNTNNKVVENAIEYNNENFVPSNSNDWLAAGATIGFFEKHPIHEFQDVISSHKYFLFSEYINQKRTLTTIMDEAANTQVNETKTYYDNPAHLLPTRQETINSKGEKITMYRIYPSDYSAGNIFIDEMVSKNIISNPVEVVVVSDVSGNIKIKSGTVIEYNQALPVLPIKVYSLETGSPVSLSGFKFSNKSSSGTLPFTSAIHEGFEKDSRYKEYLTIPQVDAYGNILSQAKTNDIVSSYIWGYNSAYPIAEVKNASFAQVAYTSFEGGSNGNWALSGTVLSTGGITGSSSFSGTLSASVPGETDYILTAWSKDNANISVNGSTGTTIVTRGSWKLLRWQINNGGTVQITADNADEVRLYPKKAQMTTYTYDPLIGVTSQCNASDAITYYEYDLLGRLKLIRDLDGKILKTFTYKYQQPQ